MKTLLLVLLAIAPTRVGTVLDGWNPPTDQCVQRPSVYASCDGIRNSLRCADLLEQCLLQVEPSVVQRHQSKVSLLLDTGEWLSFEDHVPVTPDFWLAPQPEMKHSPIYSAVDHDRDAHMYVIHVQFHESNGYLIVDQRNGRILATRQRPQFSPDGKRVATIGSWGVGGSNRLQIWRFAAVVPVQEYVRTVSGEQGDLENTELLVPGEWEDPAILRYQFGKVTLSGERVYAPQRLRLVESVWREEP